jgi:ELWxxDGT repeat protein
MPQIVSIASLGDGVVFQVVAPFIASPTRVSKALTLWKSDGTTAGTAKLATIDSGLTVGRTPARLISDGRRAYWLVASDDLRSVYDLWTTDGSPGGTAQILQLSNPAHASAEDVGLVVGGRFFFLFLSSLWTSDGTPGGTQLLDAVPRGFGLGVDQRSLMGVDGRLFFVNETAAIGSDGAGHSAIELWTSDGTRQGTIKLRTFDELPR